MLRICTALARSGNSLTQTQTGAFSSVQTFAMIAAGALASSMLTAPKSMAHVAPTQVVAATSGKTQTTTVQAQTGSAASKVRETGLCTAQMVRPICMTKN